MIDKLKTGLQIIGFFIAVAIGVLHYALPENSQYQWPLIVIFLGLLFYYLSLEKKKE